MKSSLKISTLLVLVFLSLPTLIVTLLSFSGDPYLSFLPSSWSLGSYIELFQSEELRSGIVRSLAAAGMTTAACVLVGVPASLGVAAARPEVRSFLLAFLSLGFATPLIVSAVGVLIVYYQLGIYGSLPSLALGLCIVHLPFLLYTVAASVEGLDPQLEEAACTLGARRVQIVFLIKIPALAPGIIAGALLIFVLSITEFVVSMVLTNTSSATLPVVMFGSLRSGATPTLAAVGTLYVVLAFAAVVAISKSKTLQQFLYRTD